MTDCKLRQSIRHRYETFVVGEISGFNIKIAPDPFWRHAVRLAVRRYIVVLYDIDSIRLFQWCAGKLVYLQACTSVWVRQFRNHLVAVIAIAIVIRIRQAMHVTIRGIF